MKWMKVKSYPNWLKRFIINRRAPYKIKYKEWDEYNTVTTICLYDKKEFDKKIKDLKKEDNIKWIKYKVKGDK